MADKDKKTKVEKETKEVLESEVNEIKDSTQDESLDPNQEIQNQIQDDEPPETKTVIIKKSGFSSLLALLLSIAALMASTYLYLQQDIQANSEATSIDIEPWKKPLSELDSKLTNNINQIDNKFSQFQQQNELLASQLEALKSELSQIKSLPVTTTEPSSQNQDSKQLSKKIKDLETLINQNKQAYQDFVTEVTTTNNSQKQEIHKLQSSFANQQIPIDNSSKASNKNQQEFNFEMAENLLHSARIQLNVHHNLVKSSQLLEQATEQVKLIPGQSFANFAFEIEQTIQTLAKIEPLDIETIETQIDKLKSQVSNLSFHSPKIEEPEQASWFDKLVVIRKIDEDSVETVTAAEQMVIYSQLNHTFDVLNFALLSQNQLKWNSSILQIQNLITKYFASTSSDVLKQLDLLNELQLIIEYPDISSLLSAFQQLHTSQQSLSKE
jgi:uncharacterized protein HemX